MDVNRHVMISSLLHFFFISAALLVVGRGRIVPVPPAAVRVSLVAYTAPPQTGLSETKKAGGKAAAPARVSQLPLASVPKPTATPKPVKKEVPAAHADVERRSMVVRTGDVGSASLQTPGDAFFGGSRVPGAEGGGSGSAKVGRTGGNGEGEARGRGHAGGTGDHGPGYAGDLAVIRAAIERAKNYPLMARRRGIEGTATVLFTINEEGAPQGIRITKSSGSDLLDSAARETISRAAPFPAVKANIEIPITFRLNREE